MPKSQVSIVKTGADPNYDQVLAAVRRAVDMVGGMASVVKPGQKVLINPSWVASPADRGSGACTWPEISRAIADSGPGGRRLKRSSPNRRPWVWIAKK